MSLRANGRDGRTLKNPQEVGVAKLFFTLIPHTAVASQSFMASVILPKHLGPTMTETKTSFPQGNALAQPR